MTSWNPRANDLFLKVLELRSPGERREFLDGACAGDTAFRAEVDALVEASEKAGSFLQSPASPIGATIDAPAPAERPGTVIGPYKLLQQIGEGGMGTVFMAEQTHPVQRKVALKVIKRGMDSSQVIARFEAERQALAMMDHVNIARVLDAGATEAGRPYFVMELVHGMPITKYCDDNHLTPRERLELFVPVCHAIQHAHQKGIIHRDIKPSNVMITLYDGKPVPKVIDFGVAKATEQKLTERTLFTQYGTIVGTLEYMSPEQAEMSAQGVDTRSDIYSLGVLLYELLTGGTPLPHKRLKEAAHAEILRMIKEEEPPKPSTRLSDSGEALASISANRHMEPAKLTKLVRGELDWIVMKCLEKDRNRRYETANGFAMDVQRYLADEPVQACPPSAGYRLRKFVRRNRGPVLAAGLVLFAVIAGVIGTSISTTLLWREQAQTQAALDSAQANLNLALQALDQIYITEAEGHPSIRKGLPKDLLQKGLEFYEKFVKENAGNLRLVFLMGTAYQRAGLIYRALGEEERAVEFFKRAISANDLAIEIDPRLAAVHNNRGNALEDLGRFEEALAAFDLAIQIEPRLAAAHNNRAIVLTDLKRFEEALAACNRAIEIDPRSTEPHTNRGRALKAKGDVEAAIGAYHDAVRLRPDFAEAHNDLGEAFMAAGDPDGAIASFRDAIGLRRDFAEAYSNLGFALKATGDSDGAIASYLEAIRLKPDFAKAYCGLGIARSARGDTQGAIQAYDEAIRLKPDLAEAHYALGNLRKATGDLDGAIASYRDAIIARPDYVEARSNLGIALAAGDLDGGIASYCAAIQLKPDDAAAHFNLGCALAAKGETNAAIQAFHEAIRYKPDLAEAHYGLGCMLGAKGDSLGAIAAYSETIRLRPDYAEAHCNLGNALKRLGRFQEAVVRLRRGHELGSRRAGWAYPSAKWLEDAERNAKVAERLDQELSGQAQPRDAVERIELAKALYDGGRHGESARMYAQAFAEDAALAEDLAKAHRYDAACSAALASAPGAADAAEWRGRALEWLRDDLEARENAATDLAATLEHWKKNPDLASVRDRLEELPEQEGEAWRNLWAAVDRAVAAARPAAK